jgi:hypothetical protein
MSLPIETPQPPGWYPETPAPEDSATTPTYGQTEGPLEAAGRKLQELSIGGNKVRSAHLFHLVVLT